MPGSKLPARLIRYGAVGLLSAWLAATVASQHPNQAFHKLRRFDTFALIPDWRFFGPKPGQHDHHLLVRCRLPEGGITEWVEVQRFSPRPRSYLLWNPEQRPRKAIIDASLRLIRLLNAQSQGATGPVENVATDEVASAAAQHAAQLHEDAVSVQYLLAQSAGFNSREDPEFLYLSRWYQIPPRNGGSAAKEIHVHI